jgi:hypothetical protein
LKSNSSGSVHSGSFAALTISGGVHENGSSTVTVLGKRKLCVVKCKREDLLSTSIVEKKLFFFVKINFLNFMAMNEVIWEN